MLFKVFFFFLLGTILGLVLGLVPGIHPNALLLFLPFFLSLNTEPVNLLVMLVSLSVVNVIVDYIPSILFGAPEGGNELSVLPGHELLMRGYGYAAIKLTVIGALGSILVCILILPFLIFAFPLIYGFFRNYIHLMLIAFVSFFILTERDKNMAFVCFSLSGVIGLLISGLPINQNLVLFPVLTGFFGLSMLILQLRTKPRLPRQSKEELYVSKKTISRSVLFGSIGGLLAGFLPGLGTSQIATMATSEKSSEGFLVSVSSITTSNIIFSFLALWLIQNPRSGVSVMVNQIMDISFSEFLIIVAVSLISVGIGAIITLRLAKNILNLIQNLNYSIINLFVLITLFGLIIYFTGLLGLFLSLVSASLGILAILTKVRRGQLMGVLLIPTILFFLGI
jgi:putative membrane protein